MAYPDGGLVNLIVTYKFANIFHNQSGFVNMDTSGYQIKGIAEYVTTGTVVDTFKAVVEKMFNGAVTAKGALIITPSKVIVTTPGAENKKEI